MDLSTLSIRELIAELTTLEDAFQGRTEKGLSASRRRVLEQRQELLCQELRSRPLPDTVGATPPLDAGPAAATIPA